MADISTGKKKPFFDQSEGFSDKPGLKVGSSWRPGVSKFKKRSGKGHNLMAYATHRPSN
jgi:hypothetical protein